MLDMTCCTRCEHRLPRHVRRMRQRTEREKHERREHERARRHRRASDARHAAQIEKRRAPDHRERDCPAHAAREIRNEVREIRVEQNGIYRHVHERVQPRPPSILKRPELAERASHPAVVAALFRHRARELADDEHLGQRPDERHENEHQYREPRADGCDELLQRIRAARHVEEHHEDERKRPQRALQLQPACSALTRAYTSTHGAFHPCCTCASPDFTTRSSIAPIVVVHSSAIGTSVSP